MIPVIRSARVLLAAVLLAGAAAHVHAQGVQTSILQGTVRDAAGLVLPGVTVTASSPALQGTRETVTDANGVYLLRGLAPGRYTVEFNIEGFDTASQESTVELGRPTIIDATMQPAAIVEQVQVTAETPSALATTQTGMNFTFEEIDRLPTLRTLPAIAEMAPGLTGERTTPNAGQVQIAGSFAYDNVFLVDGVDINDNLFGSPNNLFIEEAIEETQVLTSGISAEFGRFSGGVINAVTKSGGNTFEGSFRVNLSNEAWTARTPFEIREDRTRPSQLNDIYEMTFGGPVVRDRLWFFTAGRLAETTNVDPFPQTGLATERITTNRRFEGKLTGTIAQAHTLQGSFLTNPTDQTQPSFTFSIDPATIVERNLPNNRFVANWRGVLSPRVFATAQFSEKRFGFRNTGGTSTDIVDSPFITLTQQLGHYNAPYFDANDPEDRDNRQVTGTVSYFLTTPRFGSHDIKTGVERFRTTLTGGNSQSATNFVFDADYLTDAAGNPVFGPGNRLIPVFVPGETLIENWLATRGAQVDIVTTSWYLQNRWTAGPRWSFDLGVRYETVNSEATGDITTVDTSNWMPRLAASFDVAGDGRWVVQSTYGHYSGKYSEAQFAPNTPVGNPTLLLGVYTGPEGQGRDFAPGFDPDNYQIVFGNFPTANVFVADDLSSPTTREWTGSLGYQFNRGYLKSTYVWRDVRSFVEDIITLDTGSTLVEQAGISREFANTLIQNSDLPERRYQGLIFQGRYGLTPRWSMNGHWTVQLRNHGNFEGEATNQPGISSVIGDFPEIYSPERHFPTGRLNDFQQHKLRLWSIYVLDLGRFGSPTVAGVYRYDSGVAFNLTATGVPLSPTQINLAAPYASRPSSQTLFFVGRGTETFEDSHLFDASINYHLPIWRDLGPWLKFDIVNMFNRTPLIGFDTTVRPDPDGPTDALGLPTQFVRAETFGQGVRNADFPLPRTYRVSFGFRF